MLSVCSYIPSTSPFMIVWFMQTPPLRKEDFPNRQGWEVCSELATGGGQI